MKEKKIQKHLENTLERRFDDNFLKELSRLRPSKSKDKSYEMRKSRTGFILINENKERTIFIPPTDFKKNCPGGPFVGEKTFDKVLTKCAKENKVVEGFIEIKETGILRNWNYNDQEKGHLFHYHSYKRLGEQFRYLLGKDVHSVIVQIDLETLNVIVAELAFTRKGQEHIFQKEFINARKEVKKCATIE